MSVTLQELYERVREKEEIQLVAGEKGMDHIVRWVHMVEGIDISCFLEGDEVAFTTGIALADEVELLTLVKYNYRQKAAGMVINVGPYITQIPQTVLEFGDAHAFPIFSVPWRVHMANIMRDFTMQINLDEQKKMEVEVAVKNAFYFPKNQDMYVPVLLKHGYKKGWSYCVAVAEILGKDYLEISAEQANKLLHYAQEYMSRRQKESLVLENCGEFFFLCFNVAEGQMKEWVEGYWEEVQKYQIFEGIFFGGVGKRVKEMSQIGISFTEAQQAEHLQRKRECKNRMLTYQDAGIYKLLFSLDGQEILEEYYTEILGELEKYDRTNETDYHYFLRKYFEEDCSAQNVAAKLHLHRNSVNYKLRKIEEIIHLSINSPMDRTKIMLALLIWEMR